MTPESKPEPKPCARCKENPRRSTHSWCGKCRREYARQRYAESPIKGKDYNKSKDWKARNYNADGTKIGGFGCLLYLLLLLGCAGESPRPNPALTKLGATTAASVPVSPAQFPSLQDAQAIYLHGDPNKLLQYDGPPSEEFLRWLSIHKGVVSPPVMASQRTLTSNDYAPEDFNHDGVVDVQDYMLVIINWNKQCIPMDLNCDGTINVEELTAVILAWS